MELAVGSAAPRDFVSCFFRVLHFISKPNPAVPAAADKSRGVA